MPNIHFTEVGETQECTTDPCPPHPHDSRAPLSTGGDAHEHDATWESAAAAVQEQLRTFGDNIAELSIPFRKITDALDNFQCALGADIFEAFTGRHWRPTKHQRRRAKRRKLAQRRAARALPPAPGRDWRKGMDLYGWSIAATARGRKMRPHPRTHYVHTGA